MLFAFSQSVKDDSPAASGLLLLPVRPEDQHGFVLEKIRCTDQAARK